MSYKLVHPTIHNINIMLNRITPYMDHGNDFTEIVMLVEENGGSKLLGKACAEQIGYITPDKQRITKHFTSRRQLA